MKQPLILYPFYLAAFPVLFLFVHNRGAVDDYSEGVVMLLAAVGGTAVLLFSLRALLKDTQKAGLITALFVVLFFFYGHVYEAAYSYAIDLFPFTRHRYLLPAFGLFFALAVYGVTKMRAHIVALPRILNTATLVLVLIPLLQLGAHELQLSITTAPPQANINVPSQEEQEAAGFPDIYYIILDTYARSDVLQNEYGYDNSEFVDYLREKGFYIAEESLSNYGGTNLSLPSSLNAEYLHTLFEGAEQVSFEDLVTMTRNNHVMRFLDSKGYTTVHFGHYHIPTEYNEYADINFEVGRYGSAFSQLVLRTTILAPFLQSSFETALRYDILELFEILGKLPERDGPKFVFAHVLSPHHPYIFGPDGEEVMYTPFELRDKETLKKAYTEQLAFVNRKIREAVDAILEQSERPPVIVIQADHGPGEFSRSVSFGILNAYYLPGYPRTALYPSITPVNSFRVIFNAYFDTDYALLPDRVYKVEGGEIDGYNMSAPADMTEEVRYK